MSEGVSLPILERPTRKLAEPSSAPTARILVVDDVADNREILVIRLGRRGFAVAEAAGGIEALEQIERGEFDLVLLDVMMPDLNGNEVLRRIREKFSSTELPVIMVTAKSESENVVDSLSLGANDYITKPVDLAVALARIKSQLDVKRASEQTLKSKLSLEAKAKELDTALHDKEGELKDEAEKRRISEERLRFLAYHDSLTELLNRQGFLDALNHAMGGNAGWNLEPALLFIDLDGFKLVNDSCGHEVGDKLLCAVAARIKGMVPQNFAVARLGGDEFAIMSRYGEQPQMSTALAEEIIKALQEPFHVAGREVKIGASCGVAHAAQFENDSDGLIRAADLAMYRAKNSGHGGVVLFEAWMLKDIEEKRLLEADLRLALEHEQLEVFYQPQFDIKERRVTGFEALARWKHPTRGDISPEKFIPVAEESGLIHELGAWVLKKACDEATKWPDDMTVAVNLSPLQFDNASLQTTVVDALTSSGLAPYRLELEITESALFRNESKNVRFLQAIRELGVRVAMDDFGVGYSSLAYISNFQFDKIKIDRRFVSGMGANLSDAAVIDAIIGLGKNIGVETTAEGIETEDQLEALAERGCNEGQGYLLGRPLTAEAVRALLARKIEGS